MNARSLLCLVGVLALAGTTVRAENDIIIGPYPASEPKRVDDALNHYKAYFYRIVGSYWYPAINQSFGKISPGKVHIRFTIHSDGNISDITVLGGKDQATLTKISLDALKNPSPYKPFDPDLLKQVGDKYTDDFTFSTDTK